MRIAVLWLGGFACSGDPFPKGAPPVCGDGVLDDSEACDDANRWAGDGCSTTCEIEDGPLEVEPNDTPATAMPFPAAGLTASLRPGDIDCFALDVPDNGALFVEVVDEACATDLALELRDPDGTFLTTGLPGATGCPAISAESDTGARFLSAGAHTVCVQPTFDGVVESYSLAISGADSCVDLGATTDDPAFDLDGDTLADACEPDDDGDGIADVDDNCPRVPNGPEAPFGFDSSDEGLIRFWLVEGPYPAGPTPGDCEPSPDALTGLPDAVLAPSLGDDGWFSTLSWPGNSATVDFTTWFADQPAPRESYLANWLFSETERSAMVSVGADDGFRIWLGGVEVGVHPGCQGVSADQFTYPVTLPSGFTPLVLKVYDGGGAWGAVVRLTDDAGLPMTDVAVSLTDAVWADDQTDTDGDGLGDVCDPEP